MSIAAIDVLTKKYIQHGPCHVFTVFLKFEVPFLLKVVIQNLLRQKMALVKRRIRNIYSQSTYKKCNTKVHINKTHVLIFRYLGGNLYPFASEPSPMLYE